MSALVKSSIARKWVMALSGLFLVVFLTQHFVINITSVIAPDTFNEWSHFMGYNPLVQYVAQPILILGLIIHFVMGIILEIQNNRARPINYKASTKNKNALWISRNMIVTGLVVLAFLGLHMYDFWIHEMDYKYVSGLAENATRYHAETVAKFEPNARTIIYVLSFLLLMLHLLHGFQSSFQSLGVNNKYTPIIKKVTYVWAIIIPFGFIFIAMYHHLNPIY